MQQVSPASTAKPHARNAHSQKHTIILPNLAGSATNARANELSTWPLELVTSLLPAHASVREIHSMGALRICSTRLLAGLLGVFRGVAASSFVARVATNNCCVPCNLAAFVVPLVVPRCAQEENLGATAQLGL